MSLLILRGDTFSTLAWKRGVPKLDCTDVWRFFLKAYIAREFDSKKTADFEDH